MITCQKGSRIFGNRTRQVLKLQNPVILYIETIVVTVRCALEHGAFFFVETVVRLVRVIPKINIITIKCTRL